MSAQPLTGFRDFFPDDCATRAWIFSAWRSAARRFGFDEVDGPPLEPLDLFTRKSGPEIKEQLYHFVDKGGREVALRPEMTPTLARMVAARARDFKKPLKWFSIPQVFRYEKPQKGRLREHYQWNCDIMGEPGAGAEAELIALLVHALETLGLRRSDFVVRISDRRFWSDFLDSHGVDESRRESVFQALDKMERSPEDETRKKLGDLADPIYRVLSQGASSPGLDELMGHLNSMGLADCCRVDLGIIRGLAYYTGVVFEVHDAAGTYRAIAGGGRYDGLISHLGGGVGLPALGFGMGDVVLGELLRDRGLRPPARDDEAYYLVVADEVARPAALDLAMRLRHAGYRVDYPLAPVKVGRQFQSAEERGFRHALVLDARYTGEGICGHKDLRLRAQRDVTIVWREGVPELLPVAAVTDLSPQPA